MPAPRDVALDLLRGLAIVILVVNHLPLSSPLETATSGLLSAAEMLVSVSGVVAGMVSGRRWLTHGGRATTAALLRRSRKLYLASLVVVALVGLLALVPGLAADALTVSRGVDRYAFDGPLRLVVAVVTLEAGPWQFNIMAFFVVMLALTPLLLWALGRGWWLWVLAGSAALYAAGRIWPLQVLPSQSETPFPIVVWQLLFVGGLLVGWHREALAAAIRRRGRLCLAVVAGIALVAVTVRLGWDERHFEKDRLDPARVVLMLSLTAVVYAMLHAGAVQRAVGWLLLPLGRNSFYVFIMQVFVCLAVASVARGGAAWALALQLGALALLWTMARQRFLFRWVPR